MSPAYFPFASLCLYGAQLDPEVISQALRTQPSSSHRVRDRFESRSGRVRVARTGAWILHTYSICTSSEVEHHLKLLLDVLSIIKGIDVLPGVDDALIALCMQPGEQPEAIRLQPGTLGQLARVGVALSVELYGD